MASKNVQLFVWFCSLTVACGGDRTPSPDGDGEMQDADAGTDESDAGAPGDRDAGSEPDASPPEVPWVEPEPPRTEPPECTGEPLACELLPTSSCLTTLGCRVASECTGTPRSCFAEFFASTCWDISGCIWSSSGDYCHGTARSCGSFQGELSCEGQPGCNWDEACEGEALDCESLSPDGCAEQLGCGASCSDGLALCGDVCTDILDDEAHCGECGFDCGYHGWCTDGVCSCASPSTLCDGRCVDTRRDEDHCGGCGIVCGTGLRCDGGACVDVDECEREPCNDGRSCINRPGGFECGPCPTGYHAFGPTSCQDVDECATNHGGCDPVAPCINRIGSFECGDCPAGYSGTGAAGCVDIDECAADTDGCDPLTTCTDLEGSYRCGACPDGYEGSGASGCYDVDECAHANGYCDARTTCTNTVGSRTCGACPAGFTGSGEQGCTDIDECATDNGGCSALRTCVNEPGSVSCGACQTGYAMSGDTGCVDIDECLGGNGGCSPLRSCQNTVGSRICGDCPSGYTNNGAAHCNDINECATDNGGCDPLTRCTNTAGSRTCSACPAGYSGTGATGCVEIDECATGQPCDPVVTCTNTVGSYTCGACPPGYSGNSLNCWPLLSDIEVASPAYMTPSTLVNGEWSYRLGWPAGTADRSIRFEVPAGVTLSIDGVPHDPALPVTLADGTHSVLLDGPSRLDAQYGFFVGPSCKHAVERELGAAPTSDAEQLGTRVALSEDLAVASTVELGGVRASVRGAGGFGAASTVLSFTSQRATVPRPLAFLGDEVVMGFPTLPWTSGIVTSYAQSQSAGRVRIYDPGASWDVVAELPAPQGTQDFGTVLASSADLLAVSGGTNVLTVSVLRRAGASFALEAVITRPSGVASFGHALAWAGERLAVGAVDKVYLYRAEGGTWIQDEVLEPESPGENYGAALAYHEASDTLYVGAPTRITSTPEVFAEGAVYVHRLVSEPTPELPTLLLPTDSMPLDTFGAVLAITPDYLVVSYGASNGRAGVYALSGDAPVQCDVISSGRFRFASSLAAAGERVLVGSPEEDGASFGLAGAAYLYGPAPFDLAP